MLLNFKVGDRVRRVITHSSEKQNGKDKIVWVGEVYTISRIDSPALLEWTHLKNESWIGLEGFESLFDPRFFEHE